MRKEHSAAFLRLSQLWQKRSHYSLLLAAVDDCAYRETLIARLQEQAPAHRIDLRPTDLPQQWLERLQEAHAAGATRVHVCLPISPRRSEDWWHQANVLRERLADAFSAVQLLWLADADVDAAAHHAPDLWNWREGVFGFSSEWIPPRVPDVPGQQFLASSGADSAAVIERLAHIERALEVSDVGDVGAAHLLLESARADERLGHWPAAEAAAERAAKGFEQAGNASGMAWARSEAAVLRGRRGDPEGAIGMLREQVMPVFERLGDLRAKAVTMGRIADILQASGQLNEALRIRKEEQLPVYERLGEVREKAVTMGKIAGILQAQGHLDEALRIRKEEELPVFERLGDVREKAMTLLKIGLALAARGQRKEALRMLCDDVLPVFERLGPVRDAEFARKSIAALQAAEKATRPRRDRSRH